MTDTEKPTSAYEPSSGTAGPEETRSERMQREGWESFRKMKESASQKVEQFSGKWSEAVGDAQRSAQEAGRKATDAGAAVYDAIGENLFPTILIGIGAAWLTAAILRSRSESAPETDVSAESSQEAEEAKSRLGDKAGDLGRRAKQMGERAREVTRRTREKSSELVTTKTFYIAGALAGVGLLIGLILPGTRTEQNLLNELRDRVAEKGETPETSEAEGSGESETP